MGVWGKGWKKTSEANQLRKTSDSPNKIQKMKKNKVDGEKNTKLMGTVRIMILEENLVTLSLLVWKNLNLFGKAK